MDAREPQDRDPALEPASTSDHRRSVRGGEEVEPAVTPERQPPVGRGEEVELSGHPWSLASIARMTAATVAGVNPQDWRVVNRIVLSGARIDSRRVIGGEVFVPLRGERTDGHHHIPDAFHAGAGATLARRDWWSRRKASRALGIHFLVDDPLEAMQQWAARLRHVVDPQVVGITGSSGKTTTKEMMLALLGRAEHAAELVGTPGNHNNLIGLPLTMLQMRTETRRLILEMGTNQPGEIATLSRIAAPDVAVITSIGQAHQGPLGGPGGVLAAKLEILEGLAAGGTLVIPDDHEALRREVAARWSGKVVTFGFTEAADVRAVEVAFSLEGTELQVAGFDERIHLPLLGEGAARSVLAGIAALRAMGEPAPDFSRLAHLRPMSGRLQLVRHRGQAWLLDMYNASPEATKGNLRFLAGLPATGRKVFVFGGMRELGEDSRALHEEVGTAAGFCDAGVFLGEQARYAAPAAQTAGVNQVLWCTELADAARFLNEFVREGDVILVKGARLSRLEDLMRELGVLDGDRGAPESGSAALDSDRGALENESGREEG